MIDEYTTARECYETETEIIVIGGVAHDDESHNCDEMGCGSATQHIKYRIKKSELLALRARPDDGRVERGVALKCLSDVCDAGIGGIGYVGMANYAEREREAKDRLDAVYAKACAVLVRIEPPADGGKETK